MPFFGLWKMQNHFNGFIFVHFIHLLFLIPIFVAFIFTV